MGDQVLIWTCLGHVPKIGLFPTKRKTVPIGSALAIGTSHVEVGIGGVVQEDFRGLVVDLNILIVSDVRSSVPYISQSELPSNWCYSNR